MFEGSPAPDRVISDAQHRETLPGVRVRGEDDPASDDVAVNQAFDGLGDTFALLWDAFGRAAIDGAGGTLEATVRRTERDLAGLEFVRIDVDAMRHLRRLLALHLGHDRGAGRRPMGLAGAIDTRGGGLDQEW